MAWLNGASDLMTVVKSFYTGGTAVGKQDWGTLGASAATIVGKGLIYASKQSKVLADAVKAGGTKFLPTPTAVVDAAAFALLLVDFLNGFGTPNSGSALSTASDKFDLCVQSLGSRPNQGCYPDPRDWSGTAADAYMVKVDQLKGFVAEMKTHDAKMKEYLKKQSVEVARAHLCITVNVAVLTAAAGVALLLYLIPIVGPEVSLAWQIVAAFFCCAAVLVVEMLTLSTSMSLSYDIQTLAKEYVTLGSNVDAAMKGKYDRISGEVATETLSYEKVFKDISANLKSFTSASVTSLGVAAGEAAAPRQKAVLKAFEAQEQQDANLLSTADVGQQAPADAFSVTTADTAPPVPTGGAAAPAAAAEAAPVAFTPPSLAQVSAMSAQASRISQNVSQPVNQTMQQVQQIASMGQQGQQSAAPADEPPAEETPAAEAAGAASGQGSAERAPVDAAKGGTEPAAAGRERVL